MSRYKAVQENSGRGARLPWVTHSVPVGIVGKGVGAVH